jgi:uracil-DNA glycosylase family 4
MPDTPWTRLEDWFRYANDLELGQFYLDRRVSVEMLAPRRDVAMEMKPLAPAAAAPRVPAADAAKAAPVPTVKPTYTPMTPSKPVQKVALPVVNLPAAPAFSLFEEVQVVANDSLEKISEDIGECTRCKLHKGRNKIVFGSGDAKARLVFIGEGPGRDEDIQGLPFVGRAGKLLTSMIEAMGLKREQVYICNVVKCRPPDNRTPEKDEVATCSPFLYRQIRVIAPKAIVCLGAVAAQSLLATNQSVSRYRGEWLEYLGTKLMVTYHPAYLLRNPSAKGEVWKDLQKVMAELGLQKKMAAPR